MLERVPPTHYGGTERVVWAVCEGLVDRGHDVTLFASGDSQTRARLVPTTPSPLRGHLTREEMTGVAAELQRAMLSQVYQRADEFDLIH